MDGLKALQENWPGQFNTPNVVNARHFAMNCKLYGVPAALNTCMQVLNEISCLLSSIYHSVLS